MILVVMGSHERPFMRLAKELEKLIKENKIKEKVIVQLGYTPYKINGADCHDFIEFSKMQKYIKNCDILITHSGVGSIVSGIENKKPVIAIPRLKELNEHTDNHQLQITKLMEKEGKIIAVYDIKKLAKAIKKARKMKIKKLTKTISPVFGIIEKTLEEWNKF